MMQEKDINGKNLNFVFSITIIMFLVSYQMLHGKIGLIIFSSLIYLYG